MTRWASIDHIVTTLDRIRCERCGAVAELPQGDGATVWPKDGRGDPELHVDEDGDTMLVGSPLTETMFAFIDLHHNCARAA